MKRMKWVIGIILLLLIIVVCILILRWNRKNRAMYKAEIQNGSTEDSKDEKTRMFALADTQDEAEHIAELYQMELISYTSGVAVYLTQQNPEDLIKLGKENGYPTIEIDLESHAYSK